MSLLHEGLKKLPKLRRRHADPGVTDLKYDRSSRREKNQISKMAGMRPTNLSWEGR
jgi:hypothetical protein